MIRFDKVCKSFGAKTVLDRVSFEISQGQIVFVIGKSGMGKSVLLKNIVGLLRPDSGEIWLENEELTALDELRYLGVRKKCGMVFQHPALLDSLTIYENVAFGIRSLGLLDSEEKIEKSVVEKLRLTHLGLDVLQLYPQDLSFGMQKRAAIARTLAVEPSYLLFDEPTTGLDPVTTNAINKLIQDLSRQLKVTALVVSHDMHCALTIADKILFLDQGRMIAEGSPSSLMKSPLSLVQQFLSEAKERLL
ncbi:MAG: ATP-binding cassette domain-containing protein [Deltaproteobacteria bacterium]|nr:ATP-binding cassette domain-containing protein [Deltaproteobacteria bacterium]